MCINKPKLFFTILKSPPQSISILHTFAFNIMASDCWQTASHNNNNKLLILLMMMEETYFINICLPTLTHSSCRKWRRILIIRIIRIIRKINYCITLPRSHSLQSTSHRATIKSNLNIKYSTSAWNLLFLLCIT